jgi:hypothetical protein
MSDLRVKRLFPCQLWPYLRRASQDPRRLGVAQRWQDPTVLHMPQAGAGRKV